ncbi:MAG: ABC transporter substrate-binding protein [Bacilli bacterium]|nr:ABC transporter substrate-binding protein [Bacilli bacterium]
MKKSLLFVCLPMLLASCGSSNSTASSAPSTASSEPTSETSAQESSPTSTASSVPAGPKKELIYRSWDLGTEAQNNEERQLVQAFEKAENVTVHIVENPGSGNAYWDGIKASVFNGIDRADVMMVPNLDWPLASQYLMNIKEYTDADEEFAKVPASIRDACAFKSGVYAVPARMNLQGYFLNTTLIEGTLGVRTDKFDCNSEFDKILNVVDKAYANKNVVGLDSAAHFIDTMASVLDETGEMGYFTWDGASYHLDSTAFISGVQQARALFDAGKTLDSYDAEKKEAFGLDPELDPKADAWNKAKLAIRYGYTYEIPDMLENNTLNQSYKFVGNPGGKITIVGDYYGIYKDTKEPELAYKFAKWMSFGKQGFLKRMELYEAKGSVNSLPLTDDEELIDKYFEMFGSTSEMSGLEDAYDYIQENSMVEGVKVVPGFLQARQNKKTGITLGEIENATMFELLNACVVGGEDIANYATELNKLANKTYSSWMELYGGDYE